MTRYAVAWMATGCAMGAYEAALKYAQERLQFGKPIGSFQLVQDLLAKMIANITASQCLIARQAQLHAEGKLTDAHAALAKAFCTAKCRETVAWAREMLGGNGIVADYNVARFFADAEALYSYEGTYQMQNLIVGKAITGLQRLRVTRRGGPALLSWLASISDRRAEHGPQQRRSPFESRRTDRSSNTDLANVAVREKGRRSPM